jgi:hypothetical protein
MTALALFLLKAKNASVVRTPSKKFFAVVLPLIAFLPASKAAAATAADRLPAKRRPLLTTS